MRGKDGVRRRGGGGRRRGRDGWRREPWRELQRALRTRRRGRVGRERGGWRSFRRAIVVHLLRWRLLRGLLRCDRRRGLRRRQRQRQYRWRRQRLWRRPQSNRLRPSSEKGADAEAERGLEFREPCCALLGAPRIRDAALVRIGALGLGLLLLLWVAKRPHHTLQLHRVDVA